MGDTALSPLWLRGRLLRAVRVGKDHQVDLHERGLGGVELERKEQMCAEAKGHEVTAAYL